MPAKPSLEARLTRKVGPLPVWGWAAVILGAFLIYTRLSAKAGAASTDATGITSNDGTTGSAQVPASGSGSPADNVSSALLDQLDVNTSALDALTSQILSIPTPYSNVGDGPLIGAPASDASQTQTAEQPEPTAPAAPAAQPTVSQPATAAQVGGNVHTTQTAAGVLHWGGLTFTDKASFDRWARAHGTTTTKELSNHPQARSIYSTLR